MGETLKERRGGYDRRCTAGSSPEGAERRWSDRRQFPPPLDPRAVSDGERELQQAIDAYKRVRGLKRISVGQLLAVLEDLSYQRV